MGNGCSSQRHRLQKQQLEAEFMKAVRNNDAPAIRSLAAAGVDVNALKLSQGMLPLTFACFTKNGVNIFEMTEEEAKAAFSAAEKKAEEAGPEASRMYEIDNHMFHMIQALIEVGADINEYEPVDGDLEGGSGLSAVSEMCNVPTLKALLAAGMDVNRPAEIKHRSTALMIAAHVGGGGNKQDLKAFIDALLEAGADVNISTDVNITDGKQCYALTAALEGLGGPTGENGPPDKRGQLEAIRLLLATGSVSKEHLSAAQDMAKQMGHQEAIELLTNS